MTNVFTLTTTHTNLKKVNFDRVAKYGNGNTIYFRTAKAAEKFASGLEKLVSVKIEECELPTTSTIHG